MQNRGARSVWSMLRWVRRYRARAATRGQNAFWNARYPSTKAMKKTQTTKAAQWFQYQGNEKASIARGVRRYTALPRRRTTPASPQNAPQRPLTCMSSVFLNLLEKSFAVQ